MTERLNHWILNKTVQYKKAFKKICLKRLHKITELGFDILKIE